MNHTFDLEKVLHHLEHHLPSQGPLKDFIHHNTLHAFQNYKFENACMLASNIFGYKVFLTVEEYRSLYKKGRIRHDILEDRIISRKGLSNAEDWMFKLLHKQYDSSNNSRIGLLRGKWKHHYDIDLDAEVHKNLFKLVNSFLDQGVAVWKFPSIGKSFLETIREVENRSFFKILRTKRAKQLLLDNETTIESLLDILVAKKQLFEQYLFDQQFAHPGWSGLVVYVEKHPESLLDKRIISLVDFIKIDLILEIDALDNRYGQDNWEPLGNISTLEPFEIFGEVPYNEKDEMVAIWQESFEWSYYDQVLCGIQKMQTKPNTKINKTFQALFCIDDREDSIRRHIESFDKNCETFGTPGFFGVEFYYQPSTSQFYTKVCPAPITPKYLIKEEASEFELEKDIHFSKKTHHPILSILSSFSIGFFSAYRLIVNIFKPSMSPAASSSFSHMNKNSVLTIENKDANDLQDGLQIGFTLDEMTERVENVLKAIGMVDDFANLVYVFGHGASTINNTHYAGYDCGACSGRPGSVNARVFCFMANHPEVRKKLREKEDVFIPERTQFIGGLHDTTRDEFIFYDEDSLNSSNKLLHENNFETFKKALDINAKERSRKFFFVDTKQSPEKIHQEIRNRSVSLFEPRPELNHATNSLCIVGRHYLYENLFLDRRAFSNSYDYRFDPGGRLLLKILSAATPVCGGINLEYYFSRVDNEKLGAGSKLPHNVMGLIGVANGIEGDLRPGLPLQMIDLHDPIRLMMIVEHYPQVVLKTIKKNPAMYEWYQNEWIYLVSVNPDNGELFLFKNEEFIPYTPQRQVLDCVEDIKSLIESGEENLPVYVIKK
jgi:uncharacterized protein YbcC (UPF0753/DUF2309 family)